MENKGVRKLEDVRMEGFGVQLKEKLFLSELLRHDGKIVPAYRAAFPDEAKGVSDGVALRRGQGILSRNRVKEYMEKMMKSKEVGIEYILGGITRIAEEGESDAVKLKAFETLGKYLKMFQTEDKGSKTININIDGKTAERLLERRKKYEIGGRGDFIDVRAE